MNDLRLKWLGLLALTLGAVFSLSPSFDWYRRDAAERARLEAARERPGRVLNLGLDLRGGTHLVMEVDVDRLPPGMAVGDAVEQAVEVIRHRVDQFGVSEPFLARQGERWIVLQLPGISNSAQAKEVVGKTAQLEFRLVDDSPAAMEAMRAIRALGRPLDGGELTAGARALLPPRTTLLPGRDGAFHVVGATAEMTGASLETAHLEVGERNEPIVGFRLTREGGRRFDDLTKANVGRQLAIVLDGSVYSAPVIRSRISDGAGVIEGDFTAEEASGLAIVLRAGALPAPVRIVEERTVGASLGEDSIRSGLTACALGIGAVFVFFVAYYRVLGLIAVAGLALNLLLLLAAMAHLGATVTLPGIAGISLNVAMAVDANILVLERIREELAKGKSLRMAVNAGYEQSASAIFDANLTVLAASLLLFQFGTGPIKGFAITLTLGNLFSMFTATVATKVLTGTWLGRRARTTRAWRPLQLFRLPRIDWTAKRRLFFASSGLVLAASLASLAVRGLNYGIDFTGGTLLEVTYGAPRPITAVRDDLERAGYADAELQAFSGTGSYAIRLKGDRTLDAQAVEHILTTLQAADPANTVRMDRKEFVGPAVGAHLKRQAILAIGFAIAAIITYVGVRFANPLWGAAGIVALVHDVLATLGLLSLTRIEVDIVIMAAILTIAGYSINDTIVIFDRMRERLRAPRNAEPLDASINASINETLARTLLTNGTVLTVVLMLLLFGGQVIRDFALVMIVGGLVGTYSTIAIATPLIYERHVRARQPG